mgnify:CR=1 FL=1
MAIMYDVDPQELVSKAAEELKKIPEIKAPEWATFVKTGMHKEKPPVNADWWHIRAASVLRAVYRLGPVGVSKLRDKYGGKKNRGVKPDHFYKGSGNILRKALQQLEKAGFVKYNDKGVHKGRIITPKGRSFLDKIASQIQNQIPKHETKAVENTQKSKIFGVPKIPDFREIEAHKEVAEVKQEPKAVKKVEEKKQQANVQP